MSLPFLLAAAPRSVLFTTPTGQTHVLSANHPHFAVASNLVRAAEAARRDGDPNVVAAVLLLLSNLAGLQSSGKTIKAPTNIGTTAHGRFLVSDNEVRLDGDILHSPVADRVLWLKQQGLDYAPLLAFAEKLLDNPSRRPIEELFDYVDSRGLIIDSDGCIVGYEAFGEPSAAETPDRRPGREVAVRRSRTEEDPARPCAASLKVGPFPAGIALPPGALLNVVRVHPRDVVAVPVGAGPLRCCAMQVLAQCDPSEALPPVARSAAWAAMELDAGQDTPAEATPLPAVAAMAPAEEIAPAEAPHGTPKQDLRLGFFTRAMVKLHGVVEGAGKAATEERPDKHHMPAGPARPATP